MLGTSYTTISSTISSSSRNVGTHRVQQCCCQCCYCEALAAACCVLQQVVGGSGSGRITAHCTHTADHCLDLHRARGGGVGGLGVGVWGMAYCGDGSLVGGETAEVWLDPCL